MVEFCYLEGALWSIYPFIAYFQGGKLGGYVCILAATPELSFHKAVNVLQELD